ncbi:Protein SSO1 [Smittium culicis]|uniref:Protein SSO1 n=1 Tax=Smittium culicis TaxID=133412 RepID=A0A1R1XJZ5_9FUNG|nr:Protein SSO1 [Smittium culicis]
MGNSKPKKRNGEEIYDPEKTHSAVDISEKTQTSDAKFFEINDRIKQNISDAESLSRDISTLNEKILNSINDKAYKDISRELDGQNNEVKSLINQINSDLKRFKMAGEEIWLSKPQQVARLGRHQSLAKTFSVFIQHYQDQKRQFSEKNRQRLARQYLIVNPNATEEEVEQVISESNPQVFSSLILDSSKQKTKKARQVLNEVEQRHNDIIKTEKAITELSELFIQISSMINQQQGAIDSIESAVEEANVHIEVGAVEVDKAIVCGDIDSGPVFQGHQEVVNFLGDNKNE